MMDHSKYSYTRKFVDGQPWHTDQRHIDILHDLAMGLPPDGHIAEIGSWRGASTSAYVEAMRARPDLTLTCYEIRPTPQLLRVIDEGGPNVRARVVVVDRPAPEAMQQGADLVFIDGDHKAAALADLAVCLALDCGVLALHDTHGTGPRSRKLAWGSILAADILRRAPDRSYWEDCERREGEYTDRGFMVSWHRHETWVSWVNACLPNGGAA